MLRCTLRVFLTGDVMLGRGVDQILSHPCKPHLYESYVKDAAVYVQIAEKRNGKFPPREITSQSDYLWGDLTNALDVYQPDVKLINLETSITVAEDYWPYKGINYRMNPQNVYTLSHLNNAQTAKSQDQHNNNDEDDDDKKQDTCTAPKAKQTQAQQRNLVCNLANNHVLDWGYSGLTETLSTLRDADILYCGAGENASSAWKPAVIEVPEKQCRVFVFGVGTESSGCPSEWNATHKKAGIAMVDPYDTNDVKLIMKQIKQHIIEYKQTHDIELDADGFSDIVILSIHWGSNWGFEINKHYKRFARSLIDYKDEETEKMKIGIDVIHGHSSHHIKGFEIYRNKPIFYGCGDFLSDYEGITGNDEHNAFHDDLSFMYFVDLDCETGNVDDVILKASKVKHFRIHYAEKQELKWLQTTIRQQCGKAGVQFHASESDHTLRLKKPSAI